MGPHPFVMGYLDPNTSQHIFSLFGPILALLGATGGLIATAAFVVRHRIVLYIRNTSRAGRVAAASIVVGLLAIAAVAISWILG